MRDFDVIGFDADDTLWHSEDSFHAGEMKFVELISPYAAEGIDVKAALTAVERKNLHAFGYGVKAFGLSAVEAAVSITDGNVPTSVVARLVHGRLRCAPSLPLWIVHVRRSPSGFRQSRLP